MVGPPVELREAPLPRGFTEAPPRPTPSVAPQPVEVPHDPGSPDEMTFEDLPSFDEYRPPSNPAPAPARSAPSDRPAHRERPSAPPDEPARLSVPSRPSPAPAQPQPRMSRPSIGAPPSRPSEAPAGPPSEPPVPVLRPSRPAQPSVSASRPPQAGATASRAPAAAAQGTGRSVPAAAAGAVPPVSAPPPSRAPGAAPDMVRLGNFKPQPSASVPPREGVGNVDPVRRRANDERLKPEGELPAAGGDGETVLQGSEQATAANAAILSLARASRSYLIYDAHNQAVRGFLEAMRDAFSRYLEHFGELALGVRPYELMLGDEVVYLDRDRERSLSLRLFRDGVRRVTIDAAVDWTELTRLLEILSIRFVGVRQNEDDVVTLLWKAGFQHIRIEAVEGFVPADEADAGSGGGASAPRDVAEAQVPPDFDLPAPSLPDPVAPAWTHIDPADLQRIQDEASSTNIADLCMASVRELIASVSDPTDPMSFDDVAPFVKEVRDFLLSEDRLGTLMEMFELLTSYVLTHPDLREAMGPTLSGFVDSRAVARLIHSFPKDAETAPPEFQRLLDRFPHDPLPVMVDLLGTERSEHSRRVLRGVLGRFLPSRQAYLTDRLKSSRGGVAADLLRALASAVPDASSLIMGRLIGAEDPELCQEFLRLTASAQTDPTTRGVLVHLLRAGDEELRVQTVEAIASHRERGSYVAVANQAEVRVEKGASDREYAALGRCLATIDPGRAIDLFREWCKPGGILDRLLRRGSVPRLKIALAGLPLIDDPEAEALLKVLEGHHDDAIRQGAGEALRARARRAKP